MTTILQRSDIGIWLISLERDRERRVRVEKQLVSMGLDWKWFPAIDGRAQQERLLEKALPESYARNMGSSLLPGKLGVYASHLTVWAELIASSHKAGLILEDDVVLHDDFTDCLDAALKAAAHWDLVRFNCVRAKIPICQGTVERWRLNAYIGPFTGNAAYLVHREVAQRLLPGLFPQTRALDHELNRFFVHQYRQLGLEPWASHTDDGNVSTITGVAFSDVRKFKWYRRLPHLRLKLANYIRRASWLFRKGMLRPSARKLEP
jgi:glycosyl transferase family 25